MSLQTGLFQVQQWLQTARQQLAQHVPADEARIEAQLLLMHVLNVSRAWLIAHATDHIEQTQLSAVAHLLQRRLQGEPVAYLLGKREFFGLTLKVTKDTLIPRPDSETLVEAALQKICAGMHILDLGTGSGAIALAIAKHAPTCQVMAVDVSAPALAVAQENARTLQLHHVQCLHSHWFDALPASKFDLIVSNPPYIEHNDPHLQQGDLRFEPFSALASGDDGLTAIRQIISQSTGHLNLGGWLLLEHGYNQAQAVQQLLQAHGFTDIETRHDLGNQPRVTLGKRSAAEPV